MQPRLWPLAATRLAALRGICSLQQSSHFLMLRTNQSATTTCESKTNSINGRLYWLRQCGTPSPDNHHEFLASGDFSNNVVYGRGMTSEVLTLSRLSTHFTLSLKRVKPEDNDVYFCMTIGHPELTFGVGTNLSVVDILPTAAQPATKMTPKKKGCRPPSSGLQEDLHCNLVTLGLLVASTLLLLLSLIVAMYPYCLRKRARLRFIKQSYK